MAWILGEPFFREPSAVQNNPTKLPAVFYSSAHSFQMPPFTPSPPDFHPTPGTPVNWSPAWLALVSQTIPGCKRGGAIFSITSQSVKATMSGLSSCRRSLHHGGSEELRNEWHSPESAGSWPAISQWHHGAATIPAKQFVHDLDHTLVLKQSLTRRQWISLVESTLRLGAASHVLWLCRAGGAFNTAITSVINGNPPPTEAELRHKFDVGAPFWRYGQVAGRTIKDFAREFVMSRLAINLLLWHFQALNNNTSAAIPGHSLSSIPSMATFLGYLASVRQQLRPDEFRQHLHKAIDENPRVVAGKEGIGSNISEFLRHVLGQRQTSEAGMDSYDQGYYLRKRGNYNTAPWIVSLGPVSVLALVHCCTHRAKGPRTVEDFCHHLAHYGIEIRAQDVPRSDLGQTLRNLGLVLRQPRCRRRHGPRQSVQIDNYRRPTVSAFIEFLAHYLKTELASALAAAPGQELRVFFSGPPSGILDELLASLLAGNDLLTIQTEGRETSLPVFVLDATAQDPDRLSSGRCTANHLVKVRTSGCRVFLALIPPDELTNVSIDTTFIWVGTRSTAQDVNTWMSHPMLGQLAAAGLSKFFSGRQPVEASNALTFALQEAWDLDEPYKDQRHTWQVLRRLFDCQVQTPTHEESFLAVLGLPKCGSDDLGTTEHLKVLGRIADLVENAGLNPGFAMLEEQADDELRPYVVQFRQHILSACLIPADFSAAPAKHYTPVSAFAPVELPAWWRALTLDAWNRLLDSPSETTAQQGLKVEFLQSLTPGVRGLPVLLRDQVAIGVSIPDGAEPVTVAIRRASGAKRLEDLGTISIVSGAPTQWTDTDIPPHDRYVRYELEALGYKRSTLKCIVLDQYAPGVALYSRNATKITPFKLNRKARDPQGRKIERYECDLALHGMGAHQLDFYRGSQVVLGVTIIGYEVTCEQEGVLHRAINSTDDTHAVCVIETDEECYYDFTATPAGADSPKPYRVWVTTEERAPTGAASEFDRLLIEHRASANGDRVNARVELATSRATDFQIWAIESEDSFHPVVLGPDYLDSWRKPAWAERPTTFWAPAYARPQAAPRGVSTRRLLSSPPGRRFKHFFAPTRTSQQFPSRWFNSLT